MFSFLFPFVSFSKKICIDPGFGGTGTDSNSIQGSDNFLISKEMAKFLRKEGHSVYLTRPHDESAHIRTRYHFANYIGCDLLFTIKRNGMDSGEGSLGIEAFVKPFYTPNDVLLMDKTVDAAISLGQSPRREWGDRTMEEGVQMYSASPSTVFFLLFWTTLREQKVFQEYHTDYAKLIVEGMLNASAEFN